MLKSASFTALAAMFLIANVLRAEDTSAAKASTSLTFKVQSLDGKEVDLAQYQGKVVLIVNVASKCGLTPQYKGLEALHQKYKDQGLVVLGFPCNQFRQQTGTANEIRQFCKEKYGVTFPLMAKVDVNGASACDLYKHLKALNTKPKGPGEVSWNFEKFLIGRNGQVVARFSPKTKPEDEALTKAIESALAAK